MECKLGVKLPFQCSLPIEVEPYWNVNEDFDAAALHATQIEVEPYWNVNEAESRDLYYEAEN